MSERVQAIAVAVFLLVIAGVVVVLLSQDDRETPRAERTTGQPGDDADSASQAPVGRVSLLPGKGDLVVRTMAGSCSAAGGPKLEISNNQGRSFRRVRLPQVDDGTGVGASSPAVSAIAFAQATSPVAMTVAGADDACKIRRYTTTDGGTTWTQDDEPVTEWYVDPQTGGVVAPSGPTDAGCPGVATLAPVKKKNAKVFCADGTIRATSDGGTTWADAGQLADVSAAVFTGPQTGYALVSGPACKSRVNVTLTGGLSWVPRGCVIKEFVIPALAGTDQLLMAGGSGGVLLSKNGGAVWKSPTKK